MRINHNGIIFFDGNSEGGTRVELTDLKVFLRVVEEGSITRAAERLGYVQSNVTARLKRLEAELGVSLLRRHRKGVALTDKGAVLREYALAILSLSEEASAAVRDAPHPSGPLAVGVVETVTCGVFMDTLYEYQTRYPDVSLTLLTGTTDELLARVLDDRLDGAFVSGDVATSRVAIEYTKRDELRVLTRGGTAALPDLSGARWAVAPKGCPYRNALERWLGDQGYSLANTIEIGSLETLLQCVRSGLAATVLPSTVLYGEYARLNSQPLPEPYRHAATRLIRRKDRLPSKAFAAFAELVKRWDAT